MSIITSSNANGTPYLQVADDLKALEQWLLWQRRMIEGKWRKVPLNPQNLKVSASPTDPANWVTFEQAVHLALTYPEDVDGIGFAFTEHDPYVGVDLDNFRDAETGEISEEGLDIIEMFGSYTEVSFSGNGVHIICKGTLPDGVKHRQVVDAETDRKVEIYSSSQYFVMTGNVLEGNGQIEEAQPSIDVFLASYELLPADTGGVRGPSGKRSPKLTDEQAMDNLRRFGNSEKFVSLFDHGDMAPYGNNHSEADDALCGLISFVTQDPEQIDRIFRQSALYRPERWDKENYRDRTIQHVLRGREARGGDYWQKDLGAEFTPLEERIAAGEATDEEFAEWSAEESTTDIGNALRLARLFGKKLRWVANDNSWYVWYEGMWHKDTKNKSQEYAKQTVASIRLEARRAEDDAVRNRLLKWVKACGNATRIRALLSMAESIPSLCAVLEDFDRNPWLLAAKNCTLDLRTGEAREPRQEDLIIKGVDFDYDPDAKCPEWDRFLQTAIGDTETIEAMQRFAGYSITGDSGQKVLFFAVGEPDSGKTTFVETIAEMLGEGLAQKLPISILLHRNNEKDPESQIARLRGIRFAFTSEPEQRGNLAVARVKELTGNDKQTGRRLYRDPIEFRPTHKLWVSTNYRPKVEGGDEAIWNRLRVIPFDYPKKGAEYDHDLRDKIRGEFPGILAWAVRGCVAWQQNGKNLQPSERILAASKAYRVENDLVGRWFAENIELQPEGEGETAWLGSAQAYSDFDAWCRENGEAHLSIKGFGGALTKMGYPSERMPGTDGKKGYKRFILRYRPKLAPVFPLTQQTQGVDLSAV